VDWEQGLSGDGTDRPKRQVGRRPTDGQDPATSTSGTDVGVLEHPAAEDSREEKFAELQVASLFGIGTLALIGFVVAYVLVPPHEQLGKLMNYALGGTLTIALGAIGAGFVIWAKMLRRSLLGALGLFPIPIVLLLRDLGPLPGDSLDANGEITAWKKGSRLVDSVTKVPYKLGDIEIGGMATVMPEGFGDINDESLAPTVLIRFGPNEIQSAKEASWGAYDHVAYSKVCTHAGCPISLYEQQTHHLLCPCHQSTFDMAHDAKVIFGPAARPLPQLKIAVDTDGYFYAVGPYSQPVGPSFWERR
jgi:ubiquinol-cytochrome c reductase iron-sulfur subunit